MTARRTYRAKAVVTGAGSGIGRAFALELARRGGKVVCADIDVVGAKETAEMIGDRAFPVRCDVSVEQDVRDLADNAEQWLAQPADLVVNNAGIGAGGQVVGETPLDDWRRTLGVNLWGVVYGCHVFVPRLTAAGRGGIINVGSTASFAAAPRMAPYNVSKAGVLALSETLAAELSGSGVTVTALCPTFVKTNIFASELIDARTTDLGVRVMRLIGWSPGRVARAALDAHDKGRLYVVPQFDARVAWQFKRHLPVPYARALGLLERLGRVLRPDDLQGD